MSPHCWTRRRRFYLNSLAVTGAVVLMIGKQSCQERVRNRKHSDGMPLIE